MDDEPERPRAEAQGRSRTTTSGMLLAAAALPLVLLDTSYGPLDRTSLVARCAAGLVTVLLLVGATIFPFKPRPGRGVASLALLALTGLGAPSLLRAPGGTLIALIGAVFIVSGFFNIGITGSTFRSIRPPAEGMAQGAAIAALTLWAVHAFGSSGESWSGSVAVGWAMLVCALSSLGWALGPQARRTLRGRIVVGVTLLAILLALALREQVFWSISALALCALTSALAVRRWVPSEIAEGSWWEPLLGHPERLLAGSFFGLCALGTVLLALPQSSATGRSIGLVDAAFTAVSAVCVTGLVVLDTALDFSWFGQAMILLLIQVGGLGIMTLSTAALWAFGRRVSMRHEQAVAMLISARDHGHLYTTVVGILKLTFIVEGVGAFALLVSFLSHGLSFRAALWQAVFTSISAFCNAGFALNRDSLLPYQGSPLVLHVVALLIILGGLSPLAISAVPTLLRRVSRPVSAQAKLSLVTAALLLGAGFLLILAFEWDNTLGGLSLADRLHNAWFQSVTLRTAGFNSIDLTHSRPATLTVMLLWMFIGGSPGGTAGGVKTTTISVLALSVFQTIRGQWALEAFGRRVPEQTRTKAAVTVSVAAVGGVLAVTAVQLTQKMPTGVAVFEVVSALGTVGLSLGGTTMLDGMGKAIIMACMYVGRVGGLTLLMFLSSRRPSVTIGRPEEAIDVG